MANKIQLRRGLKANIPTGSAGEPLYATDTRELYIGTGSGNVNMGGSQWYTGTAMGGTSTTTGAYCYSACPLVKSGDMYLNTTYGYVYQCTTAGSATTAKWTYKGSIKGATGATGATGDKGDDMQAVYSSTPTQIGTWIDGSIIYRMAWSYTKAQTTNGINGCYIPTHMDLPKIPVNVFEHYDAKAVIHESYSIQESNIGDLAHTYTNLQDLSEGIETYGNDDYTVYCVIEYILK